MEIGDRIENICQCEDHSLCPNKGKKKVFLTYLLGKNSDAFKADVVDALLAEQEKQK